MKVYRYLCEQEYNNILSRKLDEVGTVYANVNPSNSFRYKRDERYLHFYKNKESMQEMHKIYKLDGKDYYFCEFDIPFRVLVHGIGTGIIRKTTQETLKKNKYVDSYKIDNFNSGSTIVNIRQKI